MDENSTEFLNLCSDVADNGILVPVIITEDNLLVDGRHRYFAAKRAQLAEIPCQIIAQDNVAQIILRTLIHRRHYTKSQLAYIGYPLFQSAHDEIISKRVDAIKTGNNTLPKTVEHLSVELGVSVDLFRFAARVHQIFAEDPSYKELMEPKILDTEAPTGLGAVIAGYAGRNTTRGIEKTNPAHIKLFNDAIISQRKRFAYWAEFQEPEKVAAAKEIRLTVSEMPEELRTIWANALKSYTQAATRIVRG